MVTSRVYINAITGALPATQRASSEVAQACGVDDAWIIERTGVHVRRLSMGPSESAKALGVQAALAAMSEADVLPSGIDGIICATITPDHHLPSTACEIQAAIGATNAFAFDMAAACSGFIYALHFARSLVASGMAGTVLIVCPEVLGSITDWSDPVTAGLFGDGCGACVVSGRGVGYELIETVCAADGTGAANITREGGGCSAYLSRISDPDRVSKIAMNGRRVFKDAVRSMNAIIAQTLQKASLKMVDIAMIVPHQANIRIIRALEESTSPVPVFTNMSALGNTGAASIPLAMREIGERSLISSNQSVLLVAFGAGYTFAGAICRRL